MTISYPPTFFASGEEMTAAYLNSVIAKLPWGYVATPVATASNGTATAADTVEVRDAVLGNYVFTARADRLYRVCFDGRKANSGAVSSRMLSRVRDGGVATPTAASTLLGEVATYVTETSTSGRASGPLRRTFSATAGVHTLAVFTQSPDSAAMTPVDACELYVEDIGPL